jgi:hypothetical protein
VRSSPRIKWSTADVSPRDCTLTVELVGDPPREWDAEVRRILRELKREGDAQSFAAKTALQRYPQMSFQVVAVEEGDEQAVKAFLNDLVERANSASARAARAAEAERARRAAQSDVEHKRAERMQQRFRG